MDKQREIKSFWDSQAQQFGTEIAATTPDYLAKILELENISALLSTSSRVADIGCGNGFSTLHYAKQHNIEIHGFDFSESMIAEANKAKQSLSESIRQRVTFSIADVRATQLESQSFDTIITDRCLINLTSRDEQATAIYEMHRLLEPGGYYLMCENTETGLANLNRVRDHMQLPAIEVRWHNLYLDESHLQATIEPIFILEKVVRFSSFYYLASRVINAKIAQQNGVEPSYDSEINKVAAMCSSLADFGDYGPLKLYVLRKK